MPEVLVTPTHPFAAPEFADRLRAVAGRIGCAAAIVAANLGAFRRGEALPHRVDRARGY